VCAAALPRVSARAALPPRPRRAPRRVRMCRDCVSRAEVRPRAARRRRERLRRCCVRRVSSQPPHHAVRRRATCCAAPRRRPSARARGAARACAACFCRGARRHTRARTHAFAHRRCCAPPLPRALPRLTHPPPSCQAARAARAAGRRATPPAPCVGAPPTTRERRACPLPLAVHAQPSAVGWLRAGRATASRCGARTASAVRLLPASFLSRGAL
jgi:hypothetical protein